MASRKLPGLGLNGFWNLGENWKEGGDENWLKLSVFTQLSVQSCTTQIPGSAPNGIIYIVPDDAPSEPNKLAVRDGGQWVYLSVPEGVRAWVKDVGKRFQFVGGSWQEVPESSDGIGDAPVDGTFYIRGDEEWRKLVAGDNVEIDLTTPGEVVIKSTGGGSGGIPEAPNDDEAYLRRNQGWNRLVAGNNVQLDTTTPGEIKIDTDGGGGIPDAPDDGEPHVRIDEEWRKLVAGDSVEIDTTGTPGEVIISVPEIGDISAALDAINGEVV